MKITQRELILGVATMACVLAGLTWYAADRKTDEWQAKKSEIERLRQQINLHQNAIKMQETWQGDLETLQRELRVFNADGRSVAPELMQTIKAVSSKHGLDITRNQPYNEKPTGDLFELGINCTWEGSLAAMVGFLAELQQQGVRYDVRSLTVTPAGNDSNKLKGNMVIHCAYTRKPGGSAKTE